MARARRTGEGFHDAERPSRPFAFPATSSPFQQIRSLQNTAGNQNTLQRLSAGQHRETARLEQEAERAAVTGHASGQISKLPADTGTESANLAGASSTPLNSELRNSMEGRLGADLSRVRVHTGAAPAEMNRHLNSRAFTYGQNIYFGQDEYQPETTTGSHLLAHELAHTVQQSSGTKAIQTQGPSGGATQPAITAQAIFGMPQGSKVVLNRTMANAIFSLVQSQAPDVAAALNAIDAQPATLTTVNNDIVEITLDQTVNLLASGNQPAVGYQNVKLRLARTSPGVFDFSVSGSPNIQGASQLAYHDAGLTATQSGGNYVLSSGTEPHLGITPASGTPPVANIEAYTAPYMSQVPRLLRGAVPATVDLASVTRLPDAPTASAQRSQAVQQIVQTAAARRNTGAQRQSVMVGGGFVSGAQIDPLLTASFTYRFRVSPALNNFVQVPLEAELMYAPSASVLGTLSSGAYASLADLRIPVNVRLITGFGGGQVAGPTPGAGGARPELDVLGPTLGAGVGVQAGWFRVDLRYEHLFNVLGNRGPNLDIGALRVGAAF